jgi:hypothetical protein
MPSCLKASVISVLLRIACLPQCLIALIASSIFKYEREQDSLSMRSFILGCTASLCGEERSRLKIPISKKKTVGPTTTLEYLGIILDTDLFEARLPEEKIERIVTFIQSSIERKSVRKRELLQLLGHFNFAARIIRPGRSFVSHLISLSTKVDKSHHFITLSKE